MKYNQKKSPDSKKIVFFIHGMGAKAKSFNFLRKRFDNENVLHIAPEERHFRTYRKINSQALLIKNEIYQILNDHGDDFELLFVGHSQGGLVAAELISKILNDRNYDKNIHLKGLVTIGTPWQGGTLPKLGHEINLFGKNHHGSKDIIPNSEFLRNLEKNIRKLSRDKRLVGFKIVPIAGKVSEHTTKTLANHIRIFVNSLSFLRFLVRHPMADPNIFKQLGTFVSTGHHDLVVGIDSQLGLDIIPQKLLLSKPIIYQNIKHDNEDNMIGNSDGLLYQGLSSLLKKYLRDILKNDKPELESTKIANAISKHSHILFS